jgi:hypothetical protein
LIEVIDKFNTLQAHPPLEFLQGDLIAINIGNRALRQKDAGAKVAIDKQANNNDNNSHCHSLNSDTLAAHNFSARNVSPVDNILIFRHGIYTISGHGVASHAPMF